MKLGAECAVVRSGILGPVLTPENVRGWFKREATRFQLNHCHGSRNAVAGGWMIDLGSTGSPVLTSNRAPASHAWQPTRQTQLGTTGLGRFSAVRATRLPVDWLAGVRHPPCGTESLGIQRQRVADNYHPAARTGRFYPRRIGCAVSGPTLIVGPSPLPSCHCQRTLTR